MDTIVRFLIMALNIYSIVIIIRVLLTWVPNVDYRNPVIKLLYDVTEPVLRPVRKLLPQNPGVDFSPMVVMIAIMLVTMLLRRLLYF